jgi:hypothetical protein
VKKGWRSKADHLSSKERQDMPRADFALPGHGKGPEGKGAGAYPINDASHARNALSRVSRYGTPDEKAKVRAAVHAKFPSIGSGSKRADSRYGNK